MLQFADLRNELCRYLTEEQIEKVADAYYLAEKAHSGQSRISGDPYISHPIRVAQILSDMRMDYQSIIAAILHDVIEDTDIDKEQIAEEFGDKVAELVDGLSKLKQIHFKSVAEAQAENLRKMILAMTKDIRVILIKLSDRLHNMRTLDGLPREKQRRISLETLELYAPIAHKLGMNNFREEFEDLGFYYLYPVRYKVLQEALYKSRGNRKDLIQELENLLRKKLQSEGILIQEIVGREKHLYSLYRKMRIKELSLSEIMDVYALRLVVENIGDCYRVLGIVHSMYKPIYGRFKDYIAVPKNNGYQSLHTTILGPNGVPIEVQIRTLDMNNMAENGIAAHWLYKTNNNSGNDTELRAREWLQNVLDIQKKSGNSLEFMEHVKIDLYPEEVYVFTPKGDIFTLPIGATAVDFAYAVHTDVGNCCIAAKIDRRLAPLSTKISSGQTIEIILAEGASPNPAWLGFVVTSKARSNIRHWLKMQQITESRNLGKRLIEKALLTLSVPFGNLDPKNIERVLSELKIDSINKLFEEVGLGNQLAPLIARRFIIGVSIQNTTSSVSPLAIKGTEGMVINYASCCHPIPGDSIIGILSAGRGIVIHRNNCSNVLGLKKHPDKYVFVQWANSVEGDFQVEVKIEVLNKRGVLAILANALSDCEANIDNVNVEEKDEQYTSLLFIIYIKSRKHLARILSRLRSIQSVTKVQRVKI